MISTICVGESHHATMDLKRLTNHKKVLDGLYVVIDLQRESEKNDNRQSAKYLFSQMSGLGFRKSEPAELGVEREKPNILPLTKGR